MTCPYAPCIPFILVYACVHIGHTSSVLIKQPIGPNTITTLYGKVKTLKLIGENKEKLSLSEYPSIDT